MTDREAAKCIALLKAKIDDLERDTIPKLRDALDRANKYGVEADRKIKRQQAEIERLKKENYNFNNMKRFWELEEEELKNLKQKAVSVRKALKAARTEAIKEFAERLKAKAHGFLKEYNGINLIEIDNLVKEMIEGNNVDRGRQGRCASDDKD